jgi:hypothetical protein
MYEGRRDRGEVERRGGETGGAMIRYRAFLNGHVRAHAQLHSPAFCNLQDLQ